MGNERQAIPTFVDGTDLDGFDGIMIPFGEGAPFASRSPGWKCTTCGWKHGAQGNPPPHLCPTMGQHRCQGNVTIVRRAGRDWSGPGDGWIECLVADCPAHPIATDVAVPTP